MAIVGRQPDYSETSTTAVLDAVDPVRPSTVTLPERAPMGAETLLDFFVLRFPRIPEMTWRARFAAGKVWSCAGPVPADARYQPRLVLHYRREVEREPPVRRDFAIVWAGAGLLVVDKPPHLPVTPGGRWVRNCLLHLLCSLTANDDLAPLHRIDRLTSGLVVFSSEVPTRAKAAALFRPGAPVDKSYTAVCELHRRKAPETAILEHHIARSPAEHWRQVVVEGLPPNSRSEIELLDAHHGLALYRVRPATGRKHQIRVQLAAAGLPILGDPLYGSSPTNDPDDLSVRMWLDAHTITVRSFPWLGHDLSRPVVWRSSRDPAGMLREGVEAHEKRPRSR
jgi:tRNA pseudouridine32 synthase/23S rRNA pseudouridine746 synthase